MKKRNTRSKTETCAWEGRDELNLAEFPIALLSSRPNPTQKTVQFEDRIWDKQADRHVTRKLTIAASDLYGLPTTLDDEVILGLIQLTRQNDFQHKRVFFSRYKLIRLLGWRNEGKSYARLETSLKRWLGVTFYYENAWWDKRASAWVNESFHLLERVSILAAGQRTSRNTSEMALSSFMWNDVVFRSFRAGNLKRVDMELFRSLGSPIAKRLYRFLDKRFYHKNTWEFNLKELACEHVGLSRSYDTGQLKRKFVPAIGELEEQGFVCSASPEDRFTRVKRGVWQVEFAKARKQGGGSKTEDNPVLQSLLRHDVHRPTAEKLVSGYPPETIEHHVQVLEWILKQPGVAKPRSVAGYLVQSIREGYDTPIGFQHASAQRSCQRQRREMATHSPENRLQRRIAGHIAALSDTRRRQLEQTALASASRPMLEAYQRAEKQGEPLLVNLYHRLILEEHVGRLLAK